MFGNLLDDSLFHLWRLTQNFKCQIFHAMLLCQLLQMFLIGHHQCDGVLFHGITIDANVLNNTACFQLGLDLAQAHIFTGLQLNQILFTICTKSLESQIVLFKLVYVIILHTNNFKYSIWMNFTNITSFEPAFAIFFKEFFGRFARQFVIALGNAFAANKHFTLK